MMNWKNFDALKEIVWKKFGNILDIFLAMNLTLNQVYLIHFLMVLRNGDNIAGKSFVMFTQVSSQVCYT